MGLGGCLWGQVKAALFVTAGYGAASPAGLALAQYQQVLACDAIIRTLPGV